MKYADIVSEPIPQTEKLDGRQVKNNAGGYVYAVDSWGRLNATGRTMKCECSCGGKNHGRGHALQVAA
jgi:hypothetical protein